MPATTSDPKTAVVTLRPTRAMQRQLTDLIAAGYGSQTAVMITAVDRMWRAECAAASVKLPSLQVWQHRTAGERYAIRWGVGIEGAYGPLTQDERAELEQSGDEWTCDWDLTLADWIAEHDTEYRVVWPYQSA